MVQLKILPPESDPCTFRLTTSEVSAAVPHLLAASFEVRGGDRFFDGAC